MPEITRITSEALQATVRRLLPSQQGFGTDLEAQNVIVPTIDLTPTAEGSQLPSQFAEAISYSNANAFAVNNGTTAAIASTPGFYRVRGTSTIIVDSTTFRLNYFEINRGAGAVIFWRHIVSTGGLNDEAIVNNFDFYVYLNSGDTLDAEAAPSGGYLSGSVVQVADKYGNINTPPEFSFE